MGGARGKGGKRAVRLAPLIPHRARLLLGHTASPPLTHLADTTVRMPTSTLETKGCQLGAQSNTVAAVAVEVTRQVQYSAKPGATHNAPHCSFCAAPPFSPKKRPRAGHTSATTTRPTTATAATMAATTTTMEDGEVFSETQMSREAMKGVVNEFLLED